MSLYHPPRSQIHPDHSLQDSTCIEQYKQVPVELYMHEAVEEYMHIAVKQYMHVAVNQNVHIALEQYNLDQTNL